MLFKIIELVVDDDDFCFSLQKILAEVVSSDITGTCCVPQLYRKKQFIETIKRSISPHANNKQLAELSAITCVRLCKASTYVSHHDSAIVVTFIQTVLHDLKVFLMKLIVVFTVFNI